MSTAPQFPLSPEQKQWLIDIQKVTDRRFLNPCVRAYGPGPDGEKCKHCLHLYRKKYSRVYIKCALRLDTNGAATDHKANWSACAKFSLAK